jgi:hypothetical protein
MDDLFGRMTALLVCRDHFSQEARAEHCVHPIELHERRRGVSVRKRILGAVSPSVEVDTLRLPRLGFPEPCPFRDLPFDQSAERVFYIRVMGLRLSSQF